MKKVTGFAVFWVVLFSIFWTLDEQGLFSYKTMETFLGYEILVPKKYPTEKLSLSDLEQKILIEEQKSEKLLVKPEEKEFISEIENIKEIDLNSDEAANISKNKTPLDEIAALYKKGNFYECLQYIEEIKKEYDSEKIIEWEKNSRQFLLLIEGLTRTERFQDTVTILVMKNGAEYVGQVVGDDAKYLQVKIPWGQIELSKDEVIQKREMTEQEYQSEILLKLKKKMLLLSLENKKEVLEFITNCYENQIDPLLPQTINYLELENENVLHELVEYKAEGMYRSYLWCKTMGKDDKALYFRSKILDKFSQTNAAKEIKKQSSDVLVEKTNKKNVEVKKANNAAAKILKKANRYYDLAYQHLKKSFPGEPNSDHELNKAKENFQKACKYYQQALSLQPDNVSLKKKLQQTMEYYHHCIKQSRLGS